MRTFEYAIIDKLGIHKGDRYKQAKKTASNMLKNGEPMEKL